MISSFLNCIEKTLSRLQRPSQTFSSVQIYSKTKKREKKEVLDIYFSTHIFFHAQRHSPLVYPAANSAFHHTRRSQIIFYDSIQNTSCRHPPRVSHPAPATLSSLQHPIKRIHPPFTIRTDHVSPFTGAKGESPL